MDSSLILLVFGYMLLTIGSVAAACWWYLRRQKKRPPLPIRLLRGPGEGLRRRIHAFDEEAIMHFLAALACPPAVVFLSLLALRLFPLQVQGLGILISFLLGLLALVLTTVWIARNVRSRSNHLLGYFGERAVAEELLKLLPLGYQVFHDVPAQTRERNFNIDHVVVGPSGIAIVETKTRRQGPARPGFASDEVVFDGRQLIWPWGEDDHGLAQLEAEAIWLGQWIEQETGLRPATRAFLALPGWRVTARNQGRIEVASASSLSSKIAVARAESLSAEQQESICALLDKHCRTVVD